MGVYGNFANSPVYASFLGDADWLPETGDVLISFGEIRPENDFDDTAKLIAITHTTSGLPVFELTLHDDNPLGPGNRFISRSERIPSPYP